MIFGESIVYLHLRSVICGLSEARDTNDTTRAQINNTPDKSHFIIIIINIQHQKITRYNSWRILMCIAITSTYKYAMNLLISS